MSIEKITSANLQIVKDRIREHEGFKLEPYYCTENYLTGGVGHRIMPGEDVPKTEEGGLALYDKDFDAAVAAADEITPDKIHPIAFGVVTEMIFQLGKNGCMKFKKMHQAIADENYSEMAAQMCDSKWYRQTKTRCESLANLVRDL